MFIHLDYFLFKFGLHFIPHIDESKLNDFEFLFSLHYQRFSLRLMLFLQVCQLTLVAFNHFVRLEVELTILFMFEPLLFNRNSQSNLFAQLLCLYIHSRKTKSISFSLHLKNTCWRVKTLMLEFSGFKSISEILYFLLLSLLNLHF